MQPAQLEPQRALLGPSERVVYPELEGAPQRLGPHSCGLSLEAGQLQRREVRAVRVGAEGQGAQLVDVALGGSGAQPSVWGEHLVIERVVDGAHELRTGIRHGAVARRPQRQRQGGQEGEH